MKFTLNAVEYRGPIALLVAIPMSVILGVVFMAAGFVMMSPLWILLLIIHGVW